MQASEGSIGRVFILRFEDGEEVAAGIEGFARDHGIQLGYVNFVGGLGGGELMSTPKSRQNGASDVSPRAVEGTYNATALGLIAPDENNRPTLHLHGALGADKGSVAGCLRSGFKTWLTGEAVLYEILGASCKRVPDAASGTTLLCTIDPEKEAAVRVQQTRETVVVKKIDQTHASVLHLFNAWVN